MGLCSSTRRTQNTVRKCKPKLVCLNILRVTTNGMKALLANWAKVGRIIERQILEQTLVLHFGMSFVVTGKVDDGQCID